MYFKTQHCWPIGKDYFHIYLFLCFLNHFTQDGGEDENNTEVLEEIAGPSSAQDVTEEPDLDECAIPLEVFSASSQEGDAPTEKTDDECSDDCESFFPTDLKSFAWQISRGMVSKTLGKS